MSDDRHQTPDDPATNALPTTAIVFGVAAAMGSNIYAVATDGPLALVIAGLLTACAVLTFDLARRNAKHLTGRRQAVSLAFGGILATGLFAISYGHGHENAISAGYSGWAAVVLALSPDALVVYGLVSRTQTSVQPREQAGALVPVVSSQPEVEPVAVPATLQAFHHTEQPIGLDEPVAPKPVAPKPVTSKPSVVERRHTIETEMPAGIRIDCINWINVNIGVSKRTAENDLAAMLDSGQLTKNGDVYTRATVNA